MAFCRLSIFLIIAIGISACNEQQSDIPTLSDLRVEPAMVAEFADTVIISFNYYDYNGDLGHPDPNVASLSVKDSRLQDADLYHVQPLAPVDANVPIQGRLSVRLNNLFILGNDSIEELIFEVMIQDRKGNWSSLLESDTIRVYRP